MENEIWQDIQGYEGLYQISNLGRVKSLPKRHNKGQGFCKCKPYYITKEKILKMAENSNGYLRVCFTLNNKKFFVHRLVAQAFIPNPNNKKEVNHIDANPHNNRADNLEWVTHQENMQYAYDIGRMEHIKNIPNEVRKKNIVIAQEKVKRKIARLDDEGNVVEVFNTMTEAWKKYKLDSGCLTKCCQEKIKTCGGYKWKYI